jgi:hypothetical protein
MARPFNNNMFQDGYEDFDRTGIMDPEMADVLNMRKEANAARDGATNQYEADVADFKNTQATEAEQGIASLPEATESATYMNNQAQAPSTETRFTDNPYVNAFKGKFPIGSDGEPIFEDVDYTGMPGSPINTGNTGEGPLVPVMPPTTNPYANVFVDVPGEPEPVYDPYVEPVYDSYDPYVEPVLPDLGVVDPYTFYEPTPAPYTDPYDQGDNYVTDDAVYNPNDPVSDYPFVDPVTGGNYVFVPGTPVNPGPGVVVTDPVTGELPPGYIPGGGDGPAGTIPPEVFVPAPTPAPTPAPVMNIYTNRPVRNPYRPFEQPSSPVTDYIRPMDPAEFGSAPGMNQGGRVPMGNNNKLNSGLSRLPINQQNDTLTQVFQSGFRPRR